MILKKDKGYVICITYGRRWILVTGNIHIQNEEVFIGSKV